MSSPDKNFRKAGCAVLGIICEGCNDAIRESLPQILPHLLRAVTDPEHHVRASACFALGQFAEHCQPEILHHHQTILPLLFSALADDEPNVQGTSCYVLENFCENLQPHTLAPFLPQLMERLGQVLINQNTLNQEMALAAIATIAVASEQNFLPYTDPIVAILSEILFVSDQQMLTIRGRGLECLGHIAVAIGADHFSPYHDMGLQAVILMIREDSLNEYAYIYLANSVKVMKNAFDQNLETIVPQLLEVISESEVNPSTRSDEGEASIGMLDDEDDEVFGDDQQYHLTTDTAFVHSKKAALCAIGSLADHTEASFYPHLEKTLNTLLHEENSPICSLHPVIRAEALFTLQYLVKVAFLNFGSILPSERRQILEFHPMVRECVIAATAPCIKAMVTDVDKLPAASSIKSLDSILRLVGMAAMVMIDVESNRCYGDLITQNILTLLEGKGTCQTFLKREQGEDDDSDHDSLMDAVSDLIITLAKVIGEGFLPFFEPMVEPLLKFTRENRPHSDRAMAIGCFAEVINEVGQVAGNKFAEALLPILRDGVADSMESVRRNSAYFLGILCLRSPAVMTPSCFQVMQWLYPLCLRTISHAGGADSDNALGAIARMVVSCEGVPLGQVLPVMFNALPLREDFSEGPTVCEAIFFLLRRGDEAIYALLPQVLLMVSDVLKEESRYNDLTKVMAAQIIKFLASERHDLMVGALGHITGDQHTSVMMIIERTLRAIEVEARGQNAVRQTCTVSAAEQDRAE
jgi:importin-4